MHTHAPFLCSHLTPLGHHRAPSRAPWLYSSFSQAVYFTHGSVYATDTLPVQPTLLFPSVSILYICVIVPALQIGSFVPFFLGSLYVH